MFRSQKQPSRGVLRKRCSENMQQIYRGTSMPNVFLLAKQFYWNHTSTWVFSCKFPAYFQNTFTKTTSGRLLLYSHWLNTINLLIHIILQLNLEISSFFLLVTQLFKQRISKLVLFLSMSWFIFFDMRTFLQVWNAFSEGLIS